LYRVLEGFKAGMLVVRSAALHASAASLNCVDNLTGRLSLLLEF